MDSSPPQPLTLFPSERRRPSNDSNSPEFEFWNMVRNPSSFPQQNLISADELFVNGVILPLHKIPNKLPDPEPETPILSNNSEQPSDPVIEPEPGPQITKSGTTDSTGVLSASKRWKDLFKKGDKKGSTKNHDKEKKRERKSSQSGASSSSSSSAELNINIWPFRRSRSAGNNGTRPTRLAPAATRNVSSAPCSRSNSSGESKSSRRQWPSSPGRGGVHLGRSSPVWQVKRGSGVRSLSEPQVRNVRGEKAVGVSKREVTANRRGKILSTGGGGGGDNKTKVLNLNVPMCIGYRHHLSCSNDDNGAVGVSEIGGGSSKINARSGGAGAGAGAHFQNSHGNVGNLFTLRSLFTRKSLLSV